MPSNSIFIAIRNIYSLFLHFGVTFLSIRVHTETSQRFSKQNTCDMLVNVTFGNAFLLVAANDLFARHLTITKHDFKQNALQQLYQNITQGAKFKAHL